MILVDTSIWIDHLHRFEPELAALLERNEVSVHPMVIGELALGTLANRAEVLSLLDNLPRSVRASDEDVLVFIEAASLFSRGLGFVDAHLLAAVRLAPGALLWTRDKRLHEAARSLDLAWSPPVAGVG